MASDLRGRVDAALTDFTDARFAEIERAEPSATPLVLEIGRLLRAGGKRIRPAFCYWGFRAAGGRDEGGPGEPIVRAAASLELLHTMALVHDDLIDGAKQRRGVPATAVWFSDHAAELAAPGDPEEFGASMAVLVGDLAAVYADLMLLGSGFPADALARALSDYHSMREQMAVGQYLDVSGAAGDPQVARRAAVRKGGVYTVEGPLLIGAALADASEEIRDRLRRFGRPLGEAFQLRDDLEDGDAAAGVTPTIVNELVARAKEGLDPDVLSRDPAEALEGLAALVAM